MDPCLACVRVCLFTTLPLGRNHEGSLNIERLIHQDLYNTPPIYLCFSFSLTLSSHRSHLMAEWSSFNATTTMCFGFRVCVCACVYMVVCGHSHFPLVNCMFYTKSKDFYRPSKSLLHFLHLSSPPLTPLLLSPHHPPTILPCVMHHLCRAGRPIITPACEYWSTAPVCMCYFKMLRPVISVLMIVIAEATSSVWLFPAWRYQREDGSLNTHIQANTYAEGRHSRVDGGMLVF